MPDEQCRMTTKAGTRCPRPAKLGTMGFCWQHNPANKDKTEAWKQKLEGAALAIAASEILLKIAELSIEHLPEMFGSGDPTQMTAKAALQDRFPPFYPNSPNEYAPGSRVDWAGLLNIVETSESLCGGEIGSTDQVQELEQQFDTWLNDQNEFHRNALLSAIERNCLQTF